MSKEGFCRTLQLALMLAGLAVHSRGHRPYDQKAACFSKLENALEQMVRRNRMKLGSRTYLQLTPPYSVYHSLYGEQEEDSIASPDEQSSTILNEKLDNFHDGKMSPNTKIEVTDLRVRLPQTMRWVLVDKCHFIGPNRTLDTRLMFPDLTISGKVILHPFRGKCSLILRLRRTSIELRTVPLMSSEEARRSGVASVRTDSHFAEPGFLSVFAHSCQARPEQKFRQNSKRRRIHSEPKYLDSNDYEQRGRYYEPTDTLNFDDSMLDLSPVDLDEDHARTFIQQLFGGNQHKHPSRPRPNHWYNAEPFDDPDIQVTEALTHELEQLFSVGVRSLLTTYMQKALQPPIKETLMENMGYTISYG